MALQFTSHDLGRLTLRTYDESFTAECIETVLYSFLHTVLFHRALGIARICELQYLYYPFSLVSQEEQRKEGEARLLDRDDEDYDDRLYVTAVEDSDLHYRVKNVVQLVLETLQPKKEKDTGIMSSGGKTAIQVDVEFGVTDTAHREALAAKRESRRTRRCESLWRHRKRVVADELRSSLNESDSGGSVTGDESVARRRSSGSTAGASNAAASTTEGNASSSGIFGSLSRYTSGWWSGGRKSNESVDNNGGSDLQTSGEAGRAKPVVSSPDSSSFLSAEMSSSFDLWSNAVFKAEEETMHRLAFGKEREQKERGNGNGRSRSSSAGTSVHLTIEEQAMLQKALVLELKKRCKEDEELCHRVWERWRLEIVLEERSKERAKHLRASREVEELDMSEFIVPETSLAQKALVAQHVRQQCTQLMSDIVDKTLQSLESLPVLTSNAALKPLCWPACFHVCRKVARQTEDREKEEKEEKIDEDIDWEAVDGKKEDLKTVGKQLLAAFYRGK